MCSWLAHKTIRQAVQLGSAVDLTEMAQVSQRIARGDLAMQTEPKSPTDRLGSAFTEMVANLNASMAQVTHSAVELGSASKDLTRHDRRRRRRQRWSRTQCRED